MVADEPTATRDEVELFPGTGSVEELVATAEAVIVSPGAALTRKVAVTVAAAAGRRFPKAAMMDPPAPAEGQVAEPCDVCAEANVAPAGTGIETLTPVAWSGPVFFTVTV